MIDMSANGSSNMSTATGGSSSGSGSMGNTASESICWHRNAPIHRTRLTGPMAVPLPKTEALSMKVMQTYGKPSSMVQLSLVTADSGEGDFNASLTMETTGVVQSSKFSHNSSKLKQYSRQRLDSSITRIGLVGREAEIAALDAMLEHHMPQVRRRCGPQHRSPAIATTSLQGDSIRSLALISGVSGSGKSSLAAQLRPKVQSRQGFFVSAKFDYCENDDQPLHGIKSALSDLCSQIHQLCHPSIEYPQRPTAAAPACTSDDDNNTSNTKSTSDSNVRQQQAREIRRLIMSRLSKHEQYVLTKHIPNVVDLMDLPTSPDEVSPTRERTVSMSSHSESAHVFTRTTSSHTDIDKDHNGTHASTGDLHLRGLGQHSTSHEGNSDCDCDCDDDHHNHIRTRNDEGHAANDGSNPESVTSRHSRNASHASGFVPQALDRMRTSFTRQPQSPSTLIPTSIYDDVPYQNRSDQLKFLLAKFIEIVTSVSPIVWVVDDIQWADDISMDVLRSFLVDRKIASLLVVATHRLGNFDQCPAASTVQELETYQSDYALGLRRIHVANFSKPTVHHVLTEIINPKTPEDIAELSSIIHDKTGGNVFFLHQYMQMLVETGLLIYNVGLTQWSWDDDDVRSRSHVTNNVVGLLKKKLESMDRSRTVVLPLIACLEPHCAESILRCVLQGFIDHSSKSAFFKELFGADPQDVETNLSSIIEGFEEESLIISGPHRSSQTQQVQQARSPTSFRAQNARITFVHDKIYEASLGLLPSDRISALKFRMGDILLDYLEPSDLQSALFIVANLLDADLDMVPKHTSGRCNPRRLQIAELNHAAGHKAVACSAFRTAMTYFQNAVDLLPDNHWETHAALSLDLYSSITECAFTNSDLATLSTYSNIVLSQSCDVIQKVRVYYVLVCAASMAGTSRDASANSISLGLEALKTLGCHFPMRKLGQSMSTIKGLVTLPGKVKKKWSPDALRNLAYTEDATAVATIKMLDKLSEVCFKSNRQDLVALLVLTSAKMTFKHGLTPCSPAAFSTLGLVLCAFMNDMETGTAYAKQALDMVKHANYKMIESRTVSNCYAAVMHWTTPLALCKEPMLASYTAGMATGDIESASWSMVHFVSFSLFSGSDLATLEKDCSVHIRAIRNNQLIQEGWIGSMIWQLISNLLGMSPNRSVLKGSIYDHDEGAVIIEDLNDSLMNMVSVFYRIFAAVVFRDFKSAADLACKHLDQFQRELNGVYTSVTMAHLSGIACFAAARTSKNRKYTRLGNNCRKRLKEWTRKGCVNAPHLFEMVQGERQFAKREFKRAKLHYERCIRLTGKRGLISDQAMANARLAECQLRAKDKDDARYRFDEAIRLYREWGATAVVDMLHERCDEIWPRPSHITVTELPPMSQMDTEIAFE